MSSKKDKGKKETKEDGGTLRDTSKEEMSSTQFLILAENQRKKKALGDIKGKFEILVEENKLLLEEREATQQETYEVTEFLRKEILRKNERIAQLEQFIEQQAQSADTERATLNQEWTTKYETAAKAAGARENEMGAALDRYQMELANLREFKLREADIDAEMQRLRDENLDLGLAAEQRAAELERRFIEQSTRQKKEFEAKVEEMRKAWEDEVDERLDASVKRILMQNRRMAEELRLHVQETDELQRANRGLEDDRRRLQREVDLKREIEEQYAKRGTRQARELREGADKVASLERSLGQLVRDFEKEREAVLARAAAEAEGGALEAAALRRLVKLRTRELRNVRRLAAAVVAQRTAVETFLIDSLEFVRSQIRSQAPPGGKLPLPTLPGRRDAPSTSTASQHGSTVGVPAVGATLSDLGLLGGNGADIRELPWADRERVLRLLFAKINASPTAHVALPPHSFDRDGLAAGRPAAGVVNAPAPGAGGGYGLRDAGWSAGSEPGWIERMSHLPTSAMFPHPPPKGAGGGEGTLTAGAISAAGAVDPV